MFLLGTFKFVFAAGPGIAANLPFFEIYLTVVLGGLFSFNLFYFMANQFIKRNLEKKLAKIKAGTYKPKKNFTKLNKTLVRLKMTNTGFWLITILGPVFLSVPIGTIIVAKFYRHHKETYWISSISLLIFGGIFTKLFQTIFV
jgi:hypothetical protein